VVAAQALYDKALLYRGHQGAAVLPALRTALSSHELALGYEESDESVFVTFPLASDPNGSW